MIDEARQSPREFLRARRPEYFSDSETIESKLLDRLQLEYYLSTLTSRNQEQDFEIFARKLAECEICPNLLPNTGPAGGGDGKVDTETFPVADQLVLSWFSGIGHAASSERWAFAFSAKKQWQGKVRSDIKKIAETGRGYQKAFFVSNQFVAAKSRAKFQDELSQNFKLDVRILDLEWILDRVFSNKREKLAIEHLKLKVTVVNDKRPGPNDSLREAELTELDQSIQANVGEVKQRFKLVEDSLRSAEVARALDRPRVEVDGRFLRAKTIAEKFGTQGQRVECAYEWARTAFWWYEDYELLSTAYEDVQQLCVDTSNPHELGQLKNLWFLFMSAATRGFLKEDEFSVASKTEFLKDRLFPLSLNKERPSVSLHAKTQLLEMELMLCLPTGEGVTGVLEELRVTISECDGLAGYPFRSTARIITENGDVLQGFPGYTELFNAVVDITSRRSSDIEAGRLLVLRGRQLRDADRPYEAIAEFGKALGKLYKLETRRDAISALYYSATCYEQVGLFWAARGTLLTAESLADNEFTEAQKVIKMHASCSRVLSWIEIRLGRVPQALSWHRHDYLLRMMLQSQGDDVEWFDEFDQQIDMSLGVLMLRTAHADLKYVTRLPKLLQTSVLPMASDCLLFVLGHETENAKPEQTGDAIPDLDTLMHGADEMVGDEVPGTPAFFEQESIALTSRLLGCEVEVRSGNVPACIRLAESILATLESFLSTTSVTGLMAREPVFRIDISESPLLPEPFSWQITEKGGRPLVTIATRDLVGTDLLAEHQGKTKSTLVELIINIVAYFVTAEHPAEVLSAIVTKERAFSRAIDFAGFLVDINNITDLYADRISAWCEPPLPEYKSQRNPAWESGKWRGKTAPDPNPREYRGGEIPAHINEKLFDRGATKQSEIQTLSLIRTSLWNDSGSMGTAFICPPGHAPILAWIFRNRAPALQIIQGLTEDLSSEDKNNQLRVSIIRGIDRANPHYYRVLITSNMTGLKPGAKHFSITSKSITMTPSSRVNLDGFLAAFEPFGAFFLTTGSIEDQSMGQPEIFFRHMLRKNQLIVKWARDISIDDPDSMGIFATDDPVLGGEVELPVVKLLEWKRRKKV